MQDASELNNILLDRNDSKKSRKKGLIILALLTLLLIAIVMIIGLFAQDKRAGIPDHKRVVVAKEDLVSTEPVAVSQISSSVESRVESELEAIIQKVKEQELKMRDESIDIASKQSSSVASTIVSSSSVAQQSVEHESPQALPKSSAIATASTPKPPSNRATKLAYNPSKYYIQVGSFSRYSPDKKFIKKITSSGFSYAIHRVSSRDKIINRLLIGPYESRSEAKHALLRVKSTIESGAFIYKR